MSRSQCGPMTVPDMLLQHIDAFLVARIHALAKERGCSVNDVLLAVLRHGLDAFTTMEESLHDDQALAQLDGHWEIEERAVFHEALRALARTRPTQLAPESLRALAERQVPDAE